MKKFALLVTTAAVLAVPAAPAPASTSGVKECVENAKHAVVEVLEGTPQPQECDLS